MKYRYNILSSFRRELDWKIIISNPAFSRNLIFWENHALYSFLCRISRQIYFWVEDLEDIGVSEKMLDLLILYWIVDVYHSCSGIETLSFHNSTKNPTILQEVADYDYITSIYANLGKESEQYLWAGFQKTFFSSNIIDFNISKKVFDSIHSTRLSAKESNRCWIVDVKDILQLVFSKRKCDGNMDYFYFWSWGALNTVFPLLISRADEIFFYDKFSENCYVKTEKGIFQDIVKQWFVPSQTCFEEYEYYLFLFSDVKKVLEKYGNKAYRLIFLEAGQISFLLRLFSAYYDKNQLEVQWFYDDAILNILKKYNVFNFNMQKDILLLHTLVLN